MSFLAALTFVRTTKPKPETDMARSPGSEKRGVGVESRAVAGNLWLDLPITSEVGVPLVAVADLLEQVDQAVDALRAGCHQPQTLDKALDVLRPPTGCSARSGGAL